MKKKIVEKISTVKNRVIAVRKIIEMVHAFRDGRSGRRPNGNRGRGDRGHVGESPFASDPSSSLSQ